MSSESTLKKMTREFTKSSQSEQQDSSDPQSAVNQAHATVLGNGGTEEVAMLDQEKLKQLSTHAFAAFGYSEIAYVKRVEADGFVAYVVHAADGSYLCEFFDRAAAFATLREHHFEPCSIH
jgi:hypothetical protein